MVEFVRIKQPNLDPRLFDSTTHMMQKIQIDLLRATRAAIVELYSLSGDGLAGLWLVGSRTGFYYDPEESDCDFLVSLTPAVWAKINSLPWPQNSNSALFSAENCLEALLQTSLTIITGTSANPFILQEEETFVPINFDYESLASANHNSVQASAYDVLNGTWAIPPQNLGPSIQYVKDYLS